MYEFADKQKNWSTKVCVKQLLQEGNTGVLFKYRSRVIISQLSPKSLNLNLGFTFFVYI